MGKRFEIGLMGEVERLAIAEDYHRLVQRADLAGVVAIRAGDNDARTRAIEHLRGALALLEGSDAR